jgi:hypothetical protein
MKHFILGIGCIIGLNGCGGAVAPSPPADNGNVHIPSAAEISADKERYYAQQLPIMQAKNPDTDARSAIASGNRHFLCNAGRGATVPGIAPEVFAQVRNNCPTECLDGVTDALYGKNHRRYLAVALDYSARWNQVMLPACQ